MTPTPLTLSLSLCDYVIIEEGTAKASLIGCFRPNLRTVPAEPHDFFVVAELTDGHGRGRVELTITRPDTDGQIERHAADVYFRDRFWVLRYTVQVVNCRFPVPGRYAVAIHVDGDLAGQRMLDVTFAGGGS
jgi:hypothetical protein